MSNPTELYARAFQLALTTPCQKMGWGSVLVLNDQIIAESNNHPLTGLTMCQPECIRLSITSRTESMLGDCEHSETWAIWHAIHNGINTRGADIFIAGAYKDGSPILKDNAAGEYTCLRCAVTMEHAGIRQVNWWTPHGWFGVNTQTALRQAANYATGKKKIPTP